ncbi:Vacuolar protein sorting-associated protein 16 [Porites harrisoni]
MAHVTVDWNPLGKVFYRKVELYSMEWQDAVDLSRFIVSAAPFGGPIVLIRDDKHFAQVQGSAVNKPIIHIFSSAGKELATVKWDGGPIIQMGWSVTEDLLCVADDGTVMVYDIHGAIKKTLSMGQQLHRSGAFKLDTGDETGLDAPPSSWVIMPHDRGSSLLVAIDNLLYLTEKGLYNRLTVSFSAGAPVTSIIEMAISYNYEYLAMFTDTGLLWIGSADLQKVYCEFNTSCPSRPKQLTWCAMGAYCKDQDRRTLVDLFYQDDQFMTSGNAFVQDSYIEKTIESKIKTLSKAQMSYQQGGFQFYSKVTEQQMQLMEYQVKLEEKYRKAFMDPSLSDTIYQCILQGDLKAAEQLKKEFKVPDKSHFLKHAWIEAEKYLSRVLPENKVTCYVKLGKYEDAAETVFAQKSEGGLDLVLGKCATSNRPLVNRIQEMKAQLRQRR